MLNLIYKPVCCPFLVSFLRGKNSSLQAAPGSAEQASIWTWRIWVKPRKGHIQLVENEINLWSNYDQNPFFHLGSIYDQLKRWKKWIPNGKYDPKNDPDFLINWFQLAGTWKKYDQLMDPLNSVTVTFWTEFVSKFVACSLGEFSMKQTNYANLRCAMVN